MLLLYPLYHTMSIGFVNLFYKICSLIEPQVSRSHSIAYIIQQLYLKRIFFYKIHKKLYYRKITF